jgi:aspartate kinase
MTNKLIVSKFGGSSVKNGQAMLYCSSIIENNSDIKVAIISATYNTTNQLELLAKLSKQSDLLELENLIKVIEIKHFDIAKELFSSNETYDGLKTLIEELRSISQCILDLKDFTPEIMDHLYGLGEQMSSLIFFDLLKLRLPERKIIKIKASDFIITNSDFNKAEPDLLKINEKVQSLKLLIKSDPKILIVTEGFIGKDKNSRPTTLGREGSDYSAALFGEALEADLIQIWTDVNGIYSSGPNIIENAFQIPNLTYAEATALATNGVCRE